MSSDLDEEWGVHPPLTRTGERPARIALRPAADQRLIIDRPSRASPRRNSNFGDWRCVSCPSKPARPRQHFTLGRFLVAIASRALGPDGRAVQRPDQVRARAGTSGLSSPARLRGRSHPACRPPRSAQGSFPPATPASTADLESCRRGIDLALLSGQEAVTAPPRGAASAAVRAGQFPARAPGTAQAGHSSCARSSRPSSSTRSRPVAFGAAQGARSVGTRPLSRRRTSSA